MAKKWIYWFDELGADLMTLLGKSALTLESAKLGMRVLPGFAISVDGYEQFMEESGAGKEIQSYFYKNSAMMSQVGKQVEASREIRRIIESKSLPNEMTKRYATTTRPFVMSKGLLIWQWPCGLVAPSACRWMENYLNVRGNTELEGKVTQVWPAHHARAIAFGLKRRWT